MSNEVVERLMTPAKKLGTETRNGIHSPFQKARKWGAVALIVFITLAFFMNFGLRAMMGDLSGQSQGSQPAAVPQQPAAVIVTQPAVVANPVNVRLPLSDLQTTMIGTFETIRLRPGEQSPPMTYWDDGSCPIWRKSGIGRIQVLGRAAYGEPLVEAEMAENGIGVKSWPIPSLVELVFEAKDGDITLILERREGRYACL